MQPDVQLFKEDKRAFGEKIAFKPMRFESPGLVWPPVDGITGKDLAKVLEPSDVTFGAWITHGVPPQAAKLAEKLAAGAISPTIAKEVYALIGEVAPINGQRPFQKQLRPFFGGGWCGGHGNGHCRLMNSWD